MRSFLTFARAASSVRTSHSQSTTTRHPIRRRAATLVRSRATFPPRFAAQNSARVAGTTDPYLQR